jgi:hypothetical protein
MSTHLPFMQMPSMLSAAPFTGARWVDMASNVDLCSGTTHVKRITPGRLREEST